MEWGHTRAHTQIFAPCKPKSSSSFCSSIDGKVCTPSRTLWTLCLKKEKETQQHQELSWFESIQLSLSYHALCSFICFFFFPESVQLYLNVMNIAIPRCLSWRNAEWKEVGRIHELSVFEFEFTFGVWTVFSFVSVYFDTRLKRKLNGLRSSPNVLQSSWSLRFWGKKNGQNCGRKEISITDGVLNTLERYFGHKIDKKALCCCRFHSKWKSSSSLLDQWFGGFLWFQVQVPDFVLTIAQDTTWCHRVRPLVCNYDRRLGDSGPIVNLNQPIRTPGQLWGLVLDEPNFGSCTLILGWGRLTQGGRLKPWHQTVVSLGSVLLEINCQWKKVMNYLCLVLM